MAAAPATNKVYYNNLSLLVCAYRRRYFMSYMGQGVHYAAFQFWFDFDQPGFK
jgi:hypothetical protein